MTKKDRTNLSILIVLLVVLALTIVLGYRMNQPPTTNAVQTVEAKPATAAPPTATDARIRLELVEKATEEEDIGKKNLFQYRQAPAPPPSSVKPPTSTAP